MVQIDILIIGIMWKFELFSCESLNYSLSFQELFTWISPDKYQKLLVFKDYKNKEKH